MGKASRLKRERRERRAQRIEHFVDQRHLDHLRASIMRAGARADSCIYSTRLLGVMAKHWGLNFQPLTIMVGIFNPVFGRYMVEHNVYDLTKIPEDTVRQLGEDGARFVLVGDPTPTDDPTRWPGHLVGVVSGAGRRYLVDLSIDQAHRPHKQIHITQPIAFEVKPEFIRGETGARAYGTDEQEGLVFVFEARPDEHSYRDSPDWQRGPDISIGGSPEDIINWLRTTK